MGDDAHAEDRVVRVFGSDGDQQADFSGVAVRGDGFMHQCDGAAVLAGAVDRGFAFQTKGRNSAERKRVFQEGVVVLRTRQDFVDEFHFFLGRCGFDGRTGAQISCREQAGKNHHEDEQDDGRAHGHFRRGKGFDRRRHDFMPKIGGWV